MSSSLRRGALAAAAIAFSIASLAACGAGHKAQTLQVKPDNAATTVGDIQVQNVAFITQSDQETAGPVSLSATVFNNGRTDQKLESVKVAGAGEAVELTPAEGGSLTVPAGGSLIIGGEGNASAVLSEGRQVIQDGNAQKVTFTFDKTGDVYLSALVVPAEHYFASWGPSAVPATPGAGAAPSQGASGQPSASVSGTPAATPTDAASASATASESAEEHAAGH
ncbi:DUF461 domain-containing protein [Streptomyces sp. NPDC051041]|uniref:DUF461 domain-containing protein n=1 Tax=Streptomyces sp. NPDC051041 TaxID=3365640 RepID=UPI0037874810